ncbi:hypothetical protein HMPREF0762_00167 [Slackia exigua ATCC 700122]|uniref:Uncharacterized protein n=1 Tax=Slackia exigua (strain ATCC 700122 / DSM 15923 / CIP 105133 / JCM 11022 / KCTC 5966 / S-7) TaxID=649764 RepID=D0WED6_SLAES|nr:hypothetical protein HMPREF0762_00167 [Slackia exigua ATCC 700122]
MQPRSSRRAFLVRRAQRRPIRVGAACAHAVSIIAIPAFRCNFAMSTDAAFHLYFARTTSGACAARRISARIVVSAREAETSSVLRRRSSPRKDPACQRL